MNASYWMLVLFWVIYYVLHSVLAATSVKVFFKRILGGLFRFYRLGYSILVTITLILLLKYQYSFSSETLINVSLLKYFSVVLLVIPGAWIMLISVKKYFLLLSGIRSVYEASPAAELKIDGIHRFVRHPLYSGTILFVWGLFFIFPMLNNLIAVLLLTAYVLIGIRFEEKKLSREFGKDYEKYRSAIPALIPKINFRK